MPLATTGRGQPAKSDTETGMEHRHSFCHFFCCQMLLSDSFNAEFSQERYSVTGDEIPGRGQDKGAAL